MWQGEPITAPKAIMPMLPSAAPRALIATVSRLVAQDEVCTAHDGRSVEDLRGRPILN